MTNKLTPYINKAYLNAMGVTIWRERYPQKYETSSIIKSNDVEWQQLEQAALTCQKCNLSQNRKQVVFGTGNRQAKLLIIGEAPGFNEDQKGEPFVGRAGSLLNSMLHAINLKREEVYITNVVKCRPLNNRDPLTSEIKECSPYLEKQIRLISPLLILALGRHAAHSLTETDLPLSKLRGKVHFYKKTNIPVIVTYHPAYLLRNPLDKKFAYIDLLSVIDRLKEN